jgi:spore germination protein YaaH
MSWQSLRKKLLLICALGVLTVGMTPAQAAAPNQGLPAAQPVVNSPLVGTTRLSREVFGFALGSSLSDPTYGYPSWNFNLLTTVAYFGLHVLWNGTFQADSSLAVWNSSQLTNLVTTAHAHGTKVVLTIISSDNTGTYPNALCDALLHSATTIRNTVAQVKAKGVDGVNVDYEAGNQACNTSDPSWARSSFTSFMASMRSALGSSYYLSVDTYSGSAGDPRGFFDVPGMNASVNSFFVMAYDMEYSNFYSAPTSCGHFCLGPTSPLTTYNYNDTEVMAQYSAAVTPGKVILGIPYYGRKACVANATSEYQHPIGAVTSDMYLDAVGESTDSSVRPGSFVSHRDANDPAGKERWDTWYSTTLKCTRQLFWDDAVSLGYKYDLVNRDGLRGVGIWTLNYGGAAKELWLALANHFGGWHASYDMSKAPTTWVAGQSQTFPVTVTNTGGATWPATGHTRVDLDLHFTALAGGSAKAAYWVSSKIFSLPADVAPGNSVTVNVTFAAPARTGAIVLEAQMIKEHQFWFKQWAPIKASVAAAIWAATYDLHQAPTGWTLLHTQTFPVTVTNTGNTTWPAGGYYRVDLDLHFTSRTGGSSKIAYWTTSQAFSLPGDVAPGKSAAVTVTVKAPPGTGSMFLEAEMIKEHQFWFKQYRAITAIAAPPGWSATYGVTQVPTTWVVGKAQTFTVTVTNNGTQAWPSTGYTEVDLHVHFATSAGGAANRARWLSSTGFKLPKAVAAGQSVTVTVTVAPPRSGSLVLEVEMIKEHQFWFLQYASVTVTVT